MKYTVITVLVTMSMVSGAFAQDPSLMPHNEEKYKQLQAMRVYTIIDALDIDASSTKGIAILDLINKQSDINRSFATQRMMQFRMLVQALRAAEPNEEMVNELVSGIEQLQFDFLNHQMEFQKQLISLLSPVERGKLIVAEEMFKNRLRRAMQEQGRGPRNEGRFRENRK